MLENRVFRTNLGDIKAGDDATTKDVKLFFQYQVRFENEINRFGFNLPNHGKDAKMLYEASDLFSKELIEKARKEITADRILQIQNEIYLLERELEILRK